MKVIAVGIIAASAMLILPSYTYIRAIVIPLVICATQQESHQVTSMTTPATQDVITAMR